MELFGAKFKITLGTWRLRFVLMLEENDVTASPRPARAQQPHHVTVMREQSGIR